MQTRTGGSFRNNNNNNITGKTNIGDRDSQSNMAISYDGRDECLSPLVNSASNRLQGATLSLSGFKKSQTIAMKDSPAR